jgi:peptidoglycan/LPS O-acetylase OafA/YrhL
MRGLKAGATSATPGRYPEVDGLRAIAISLVLLNHYFSHSFPSGFVRTVTSFGWVGVDLFFVISGFLIGGILLDQRRATNYYRVFYVRRFFRIIPLYLVVVAPAFLVVILGWQHRFAGHSLGQLDGWVMLLYLCFLQNLGGGLLFATPNYLGVMWSLAVEEQFYLLLPPVIRRLDPVQLLKWIVAGILAAPLVRGLLFLLLPDRSLTAGMAAYALLPCRWDSLLLGVVTAYVIRNPALCHWWSARQKGLRLTWLALGLGMAGFAVSGVSQYHPLVAIGGYSWIAAFFTLTLLLARLNPAGSLFRLLSLDLLKPIATVSYGLYLLQGPVLTLKEALLRRTSLPEVGWTTTGVNVLALAATAVAAAISWRLYESPLIRIGHRNSYQFPEESTPASQSKDQPAAAAR